MNSIDFLCDVYSDFCSKHKLEHVSADEQDGLNEYQQKWVTNFIDVWDRES